jgi:hypothetical protein
MVTLELIFVMQMAELQFQYSHYVLKMVLQPLEHSLFSDVQANTMVAVVPMYQGFL